MLHQLLGASFPVKLGAGILAGAALAGAVAGGFALSGEVDDDGPPAAVYQYLGQDSFAICVESHPVLGAKGAAGDVEVVVPDSPDPAAVPDSAELKAAVEAAIEFGRAELWRGTYLETAAITVDEGCELEPLHAFDTYVLDSRPETYSVNVFFVTEEQAEALMVSVDPSFIPVTGLAYGPRGCLEVGDCSQVYGVYLRGQEDLVNVRAIAETIGSLYGRPEGEREGECDPDEPRCIDFSSATPPALDEDAPSGGEPLD
jgi:hypothetical protein